MNSIYIMLLIVFACIALTLGAIMILQHKRKGSPKRCTHKTEGIITSFDSYDVAAHNVKVEYIVDGRKYTCAEKMATTVEKLGFGRRKTKPLLYGKQKGDTVTIMYNEADPKDSYILENYDGKSYIVN